MYGGFALLDHSLLVCNIPDLVADLFVLNGNCFAQEIS